MCQSYCLINNQRIPLRLQKQFDDSPAVCHSLKDFALSYYSYFTPWLSLPLETRSNFVWKLILLALQFGCKEGQCRAGALTACSYHAALPLLWLRSLSSSSSTASWDQYLAGNKRTLNLKPSKNLPLATHFSTHWRKKNHLCFWKNICFFSSQCGWTKVNPAFLQHTCNDAHLRNPIN